MTGENSPNQPKRPPTKGSFKKGQTGNPHGRPKVAAEVAALAREHTAEALAVVVDLMRNGKDERTRLSAALSVIERGHGTPLKSVDVTSGGQRVTYILPPLPPLPPK